LFETGLSLLRNEALSLAWFRHRGLLRMLAGWHDADPFDVAWVFSSSMAPYWVALDRRRPLPAVVDFVDVDSRKWRQYAEASIGPKAWIYRREERCLTRWERRVAAVAHRSLFVNPAEVEAFASIAPFARAEALPNGVDLEHFRRPAGRPAPSGPPRLVFVGMMDYHANVDAVRWFAEAVLPRIREHHPAAVFDVVGARPTPDVQRLERIEGVRVTGRVEDVRSWLWDAAVAVVPLRIAQGTQNKVLEAMAASTPVVATPAAVRGTGRPEGPHVRVAADAVTFARCVRELLDDPVAARRQVEHAHAMIEAHHSWDRSADRLAAILEEAAGSRRP
jgi:sugar transferase (PEP-CTERM/EpsH1 system associated)